MSDRNAKGLNAAAAMITAATMLSTVLNITGVDRMDAGTLETLKEIIDIGITPVLLIVFVCYFINKSKGDDKRVNAAYKEAQEKIEEMAASARKHEDMVTAENARREEMLRSEAEKRESMLRKEAEKRESMLMLNMEKITSSMDSITRTLDRMESSFSALDSRLEKIEYKISGDGGRNG